MARDLNLLTPRCRQKCELLLAAAQRAGIHLLVTYTLRTSREQDALWAQGREPLEQVNRLRSLAGMFPIDAAHNHEVTWTHKSRHLGNSEGLSEAFDVAIFDLDQRITWDPKADVNKNGHPDWPEIGAMGEMVGLTWGGRFPNVDACHFQDDGKEPA